MKFQFAAKIRESGSSHVVTVPSDLVKHGMVKQGELYLFEIMQPVKKKEVQKNEVQLQSLRQAEPATSNKSDVSAEEGLYTDTPGNSPVKV